MTTLVQARQAVADAINSVDGYTAYIDPLRVAKAGDAFVRVSRVQRGGGGFRTYEAEIEAYLILGQNEEVAGQLFDADGLSILTALDTVPSYNVSLEPTSVIVGPSNTAMPSLVLTVTMEVS